MQLQTTYRIVDLRDMDVLIPEEEKGLTIRPTKGASCRENHCWNSF